MKYSVNKAICIGIDATTITFAIIFPLYKSLEIDVWTG